MAFNKGSLARINHPALAEAIARGDRWAVRSHESDIGVWRRATPADNEAWRANLAERARAAEARGESTFSIYCDSAGEPRLPPTDAYFSRGESWDIGTVVTIIRGRCRAPRGYGNVPNCAEVMLPNGNIAFIKKEFLAAV
jgi:hypothetical protein